MRKGREHGCGVGTVVHGGGLTALQVARDRSRDAHLGAGGGLGHIGGLSQAAHEGC